MMDCSSLLTPGGAESGLQRGNKASATHCLASGPFPSHPGLGPRWAPAYLPGGPESGLSPGGGNGNPLQYSCMENPVDGGAWWATVHGVAKSRTLH